MDTLVGNLRLNLGFFTWPKKKQNLRDVKKSIHPKVVGGFNDFKTKDISLGFQTPGEEVFGPQNIPKTPSQEVFGRLGLGWSNLNKQFASTKNNPTT